ncbi:hypothetical protein F2Q69_00015198 [Brassica cretica]|uniref:Uncharacterized protein n=1 Tax=Brassica cretica TaxID=69181 RepID=A0A8S9R2A4_BRACR|nr:hypothetical protein F2Q69_00015198 [Brassica cretica]
MLGKKNVTTHDLEIKPCSSLGWIKHNLSQGNGNVSKPATDRFECDYRNTDKPSSVTTQRPDMHTARSMRSDQAQTELGRYVATELFRNVDTTRIHLFSSTLRCCLPKTVANLFHVFRHSKSSIKLYDKNRGKFVFIERSRNKRFKTKDGHKGPKT